MDVPAMALAALAAPAQHRRLLRLHTPLGTDALLAEGLRARESLDDGGFRLDLTALSVDAHLAIDGLVGQRVLLEIAGAGSARGSRPFHGHVTACELAGANGGLARYRLRVEPWLTFLRHRTDCRVFRDMTLVEIVEALFAGYAGAGVLAPAWRWELADGALYRRRSLTTQFQESDFAFLHRLLADAGVFYWFEHEGAPEDESLGGHAMVLCDHADAFADAGPVRFHRAGATEAGGGIEQWRRTRRWQAWRLERSSWDYRAVALRRAHADGDAHGEVIPVDADVAGPYAWVDGAEGELRAQRQMEAMQVRAHAIDGAGGCARLAAGASFELAGHPAHPGPDGRRFACIAVSHEARSNLDADLGDAVGEALGPAPLPAADILPGGYRNRFSAIPAGVAYRPRTVDGHGLRLHPRPLVRGTLGAIVASDGGPLLTDRDHRIQVQFPWVRRRMDGACAAPGDGLDASQFTTWARVATPWAGDNWGVVAVPRRGQEVLVAFLEGDIDRPVVVGALYGGRGQDDAQHNLVASGSAGATGNAPAWFEGNGHAAVFTGFKSQALASSQDGSGGYQMLRLDDTPGEGRAELASTQHASALALGHMRSGKDNVRGTGRGFGAELRTAASGAIRAGAGLLLTTAPGRQQLEDDEALTRLGEGERLLQSLADAAAAQQAQLPGDTDALPAQLEMQRLRETLQAARAVGTRAGGDGSVGGGDGEAPAWSSPQLVGSSPDGVLALTPADQAWVAGTSMALLAGAGIGWMSQGETVVAAGGGIALFAQGGAPPGGQPCDETGIALHAAQGAVSARAHRGEAAIAARDGITIASVQGEVNVAAPDGHVLLACQGAYLKLEGDGIELGAPGTIAFKATHREFTGPAGAGAAGKGFGEAEPGFCDYAARQAEADGAAIVRMGGS